MLIVCLTNFQLYVGLYDTRLEHAATDAAVTFTGYCRLSNRGHACVGTLERQTLRGYLRLRTASGSTPKIDEAATD